MMIIIKCYFIIETTNYYQIQIIFNESEEILKSMVTFRSIVCIENSTIPLYRVARTYKCIVHLKKPKLGLKLTIFPVSKLSLYYFQFEINAIVNNTIKKPEFQKLFT